MKKGYLFAAAAVVVLLAAGVWWFVIRDDAPPPVSLDDAVAAASSTPAPPDPGSVTVAPTAPPTTVATTPAAPALDGSWAIDPTRSFVGYRVEEELANFGFNEAVGRTSEVSGSLALAGATIEAVDVTVDMTTLRSDSSFRDGRLETQALETRAFPTATFALAAPIALDGVPAEGDRIDATAVGDLTIHGVTNRVEVPVAAQLVGDTIVVVASVDVAFADYDIAPPTAPALVSIEERGILEMELFFTSP